MNDLRDRDVAAVLAGTREDRRADVEAELVVAVEDAVEARIEAGHSTSHVGGTSLTTSLSDPGALVRSRRRASGLRAVRRCIGDRFVQTLHFGMASADRNAGRQSLVLGNRKMNTCVVGLLSAAWLPFWTGK